MSFLRSLPALRNSLVMRYSPWLIIGMAAILGFVIITLAVRNAQREKAHMVQNLTDRAESLIWALEAGARTGMGMNSNSMLVQALLEETAKQPGIVYMAVADKEGLLLAHSNRALVGKNLYDTNELSQLGVTEKRKWRTIETQGMTIFEVYRVFSPLPGFHRHMWHNGAVGECNWGMIRPGAPTPLGLRPSSSPQGFTSERSPTESAGRGMIKNMRNPNEDSLQVFIGLATKPFEEALAEDFRHTTVTAFVLGCLGLGGFVSLFWAQHYQRSRRLLQDTRAFASEIVTSLPIGLLTTDATHTITLINKVAADILKKNPEQKDIQEGTPLASVQGLDWGNFLQRLATEGSILEEEHSMVQSDAEVVPVSLSASRIANDEGVSLGHLFLLRDMREVKRLQEAVQRSERLSTLGNMAARMAHEIRNPLSSIKGFATYFAEKNTTAPDKEIAATMIGEVDRLNRVVSELLTFARPTPLHLTDGDVNAVITNSLRLITIDAQHKGITVSFEPDPLLPPLRIDAERLTQAFLNLFINAVQAMGQGGSLQVATHITGKNVIITISDTGCGIPPDITNRIFTPYFTTKVTGTGLGLAIVQNVLEEHLGEIKVSSTLGQGSVFTIILQHSLDALKGIQ